MSTERTGMPPMDHGKAATDTKAAREEKQKVEKVREIDADEETQRRKKKFQMLMGDEDMPVDLEPRMPSPFETEFYAAAGSVPDSVSGPGVSATAGGVFGGTPPELGDVEDSIVPSPSYSPPPDITSMPQAASEDESDSDLPQSNNFWDDLDFPPDQPLQQPLFQETPQSQARSQQQSPETNQQAPGQTNTAQPKQKKSGPGVQSKGKVSSPLGPPGKPTPKAAAPQAQSTEKPPFFAAKPEKKEAGKKAQPPVTSPFEEKTGETFPPPARKGAAPSPVKGFEEKESEEMPTSSYAGSLESPQQIPALPPGRREAAKGKGKAEEESSEIPAPRGIAGDNVVPFKAEAESGGEGRGRRGEKEHGVEIVSPSSPSLPADIQPIAQAASMQAAPYLRPETLSLYYQMVGTIYVMSSPATGVSRTEILLNNPAFADSKFFGSTITIVKYASAPDSFNIRLTGNDEAVTAFKDNIPGLMTAFQNGKFNFRINRVEAEYSTIKPVFRRKEKGEEGGFGGDFRDRSK